MHSLKPMRRASDEPHGLGFPAADIHVPADGRLRRVEFGLRLLHQRDDFLRPLAEKHPFLGERDFSFSAQEQRFPHFFLKLHHLARKGGLGDVQGLRRPGYGFLPGHRQKVTQDS